MHHIVISTDLLSPLLVVVSIPLHLKFVRPRISYHIPGMLKRVGLGMVLMILALAATLAMDVAVHKRETVVCMFHGYAGNKFHRVAVSGHEPPPLYQNVYFLTSYLD